MLNKRRNLFITLVLVFSLIFSFSLILNAQEDIVPTRIVLTWQSNPQTTMSMTWRTQGEADSLVYYKPKNTESANFESIQAKTWTFEGTKYWIHGTEIRGLKPGTQYISYVKTGTEESEKFIFETAPEKSENIKFLAGGDSRTNREDRREIMRKAAELDPDFVMFTGDLINTPFSDSNWEEWFEDWSELMITENNKRIPLVPAIGNHEVKGGYFKGRKDAKFYYNNLLLAGNEKYYKLDYGPDLTLLNLDSDHTSRVYGGEQIKWLKNTLNEENNEWLVTQYHVPGWPSYKSFHNETSRSVRDHWIPLFEKHGIDLAIEANDHSYKVTEKINGLKRYKEDLDQMINNGIEKAREDYDPDKDYTPWNMAELSALSGGDWQEVEGVDSIIEGMEELAYYSSLYLKDDKGELNYDLVYNEIAKSTLFNNFWEEFNKHYDAFDEEGITYIGDGGWGAPLRGVDSPDERWYLKETASQYNFFEINLMPGKNTMTVTPHIWEDQEEWITLEGFKVEH